MIKIWKYNTSTVYELIGEVRGRVRDGVFFIPGQRINYFRATVAASRYRISSGGTLYYITPSFFSNYNNPVAEPWICQIYDENGSPLAAGIIDPASIEYDYARLEMTFNVVSPLYLLELSGSVGGRNVYEIKPTATGWADSSGNWLSVIVPKNENYNSWITSDLGYVEWDGGIAGVKEVNALSNNAGYQIILYGYTVSTDVVGISANVASVNFTGNTYIVRFNLPGFNTKLIGSVLLFLVPAGYFPGNNDANLVAINATVRSDGTNTYIEVQLPKPSSSSNQYAIGQTVTVYYYAKTETKSALIDGKVRLIGKKYFNLTLTQPTAPHVLIQQLLPSVSPIFNASYIINPTGFSTLLFQPEGVPSPQPARALEEILGACAAFAECIWRNGTQPPTIVIKPLSASSTETVTVGDAVISFKQALAPRAAPGVVVRYSGDNLQKDHVGFVNNNISQPDTVPDADGTIEVRAAVPALSITTLKDGTKRSRLADNIAALVNEFYRNYVVEATATVRYGDESLVGKVVRLSLQTVSATGGPGALATSDWYVVEDEFELGSDEHRLKLWAKQTSIPYGTPKVIVATQPGVLSGETLRVSITASGLAESVSAVYWEIYKLVGNNLNYYTSGTDYATYKLEITAPTTPGVYAIKVRVTTSATNTQIWSDPTYFAVINPTWEFPVDRPIEVSDIRILLDPENKRIEIPSSIGANIGRIADENPDNYTVFQSSGPFIANGSFESGSGTTPSNWNRNPSNQWLRASGGAADGNFYLYVSIPYGNTGPFTASQTVSYTGRKGKLVRLTFWTRTDLTTLNHRFFVKIAVKDSTTTIVEKTFDNDPVPTNPMPTQWSKYSLYFEVPESESITYEILAIVENWASSPTSPAYFYFDGFVDTVFEKTEVLISPRGLAVGSRWGETRITSKDVKIAARHVSSEVLQFDATSEPTVPNGAVAIYYDGKDLRAVFVNQSGNKTVKKIQLV